MPLGVVKVMAMVILTLGMASPAVAGEWSTLHRPYSYANCVYSRPLNMAMHVGVSGELVYKRSNWTWPNTGNHDYKRLRLQDPAVRSWATTSCTSTNRVKYKGADLSQYWSEFSCSNSVRISVGFPWGVSVSPTSHCGDENRGVRATSPRGRSSHHAQHNTGRPIYFKQRYVNLPWACVDFTANAVLYRGSDSDSLKKGDYRFCTPYVTGSRRAAATRAHAAGRIRGTS